MDGGHQYEPPGACGACGATSFVTEADLARTLIHEYAHALLHFGVDDDTELSKREVEAEAIAYVVGRYCGLDTSGSAFYLAAWESDDPEVVRERFGRSSRTATHRRPRTNSSRHSNQEE